MSCELLSFVADVSQRHKPQVALGNSQVTLTDAACAVVRPFLHDFSWLHVHDSSCLAQTPSLLEGVSQLHKPLVALGDADITLTDAACAVVRLCCFC